MVLWISVEINWPISLYATGLSTSHYKMDGMLEPLMGEHSNNFSFLHVFFHKIFSKKYTPNTLMSCKASISVYLNQWPIKFESITKTSLELATQIPYHGWKLRMRPFTFYTARIFDILQKKKKFSKGESQFR